eukprot:CAMPEP_0197716630 /NCGR_PEP_ID=MMETSP1434-20131217/1453_1 /TAXON_ID=265543 /ORGANISM="Minutocellus polymorphus, Strain CCMP3303" /LENGTH=372 /DNA_ID=CAMNT_0043301019 /DNA_START=106 /DNA_END=1224 /DNA_ORIENTATION=+
MRRPFVYALLASALVGTRVSASVGDNLQSTSFDLDADWMRVRLGLDEEDDGTKRKGRDRKSKNKRKDAQTKNQKPKEQRPKKANAEKKPFRLPFGWKPPQMKIPQINFKLPPVPQIQLPRIDVPKIGFDLGKFIQDIGKRLPFGKKDGKNKGTHLRQLAEKFQAVDCSGGQINAVALLDACNFFGPMIKSFGPDAAAKDFMKNLKKAEHLRKHYSGLRGAKKAKGKLTLSTLLSAEVDAGIHKPGGILKDPSGAVGFLWMRRSIAYQHALFKAVTEGSDPKEAAFDAYKTTLMAYHGAIMRRLYMTFLSQCTPKTTDDFIAQISGCDGDDLTPEMKQATIGDLRRLVSLWEPLLASWKITHEILDLEDVRRH